MGGTTEEGAAAPATFAVEIGVIIPPPELKAVIDRTADFVRRTGPAFEQQLIAKQGGQKRFQFLNPENPYHAYYRQQIRQPGAGATDDQSAQPVAMEAETAPSKAKEEKKEPVKEPTLLEKIAALQLSSKFEKAEAPALPPAADAFTVRIPSIYTSVDVDIVKLTAQFVARNGRQFLAGLSAREQNNRQFDFLKPTHPLFSIFQQLVAAYAQIILARKEVLDELREDVANPERVLDRILTRTKHELKLKHQDEERLHKEEEDRTAMAMIDWQQFVVVETITFNDEEDAMLPPPRATIDEINMMLAQQAIADQNAGLAPASSAVDEDMDMDMDVESKPEPVVGSGGSGAAEPEETPEEIEARIRRRYDESRRREAAERALKVQRCPVCGEDIPIEEMSEHVRIELLDPKWKSQRMALQEKQRETSLTDASDIGANLARLARNRADVFIDTEDERAKRDREEKERLQAATTVQWDGHSSTAGAASAAAASAAAAVRSQLTKRAPPAPPAAAPPRPPGSAPAPPGAAAPLLPLPTPAAAPAPPGAGFVHPSRLGAVPNTAAPAAPVPPANAPLLPTPPMAAPLLPGGFPPHPGFPMAPAPGLMGMPPVPGVPGMLPGVPGMPPVPGAGVPGGLPLPGAPALPGVVPGLPGMPPHLPPEPDWDDTPEPPTKRVRPGAGPELVPEDEWAASNPGPLSLTVQVPKDDENKQWGFNGQTFTVSLDVRATVQALKDQITAALGIPGPKQKLRVVDGQHLNKDEFSLAKYNVPNNGRIDLGVKERGGRRK